MIQYHDAGGGEHVVQLDNKTVGTIKPTQGGYAYFPKGSGRNRTQGETFRTVGEVKRSLEEE